MKLNLIRTLALLVLTPACIMGKSVGDSPGEDGTGGDPTPMDDTRSDATTVDDTGGDVADTASTGDSDEGGDPMLPPGCELNPSFTCDAPLDCTQVSCGGVLSEIDEDGCLRARCDVEACADGFTCVTLGDWGSCAPSWSACSQSGDDCGCGATGDCQSAVSICVEDEIAPPAACHGFTDEASCLDAGCSTFFFAPRVAVERASACSCAEMVPTCLWFPGGEPGGDDAITPYLFFDEELGLDVRLLPASYDESPLGWRRCEETLDAETCACASALDCQ